MALFCAQNGNAAINREQFNAIYSKWAAINGGDIGGEAGLTRRMVQHLRDGDYVGMMSSTPRLIGNQQYVKRDSSHQDLEGLGGSRSHQHLVGLMDEMKVEAQVTAPRTWRTFRRLPCSPPQPRGVAWLAEPTLWRRCPSRCPAHTQRAAARTHAGTRAISR